MVGTVVTGVGLVVTETAQGEAATNGLAVMWFGAVLVVRYVVGHHPAGILVWPVGGAGLYLVFAHTDLPRTLTGGGGRSVVSGTLLALAVAVYLRSRHGRAGESRASSHTEAAGE